MKFLLTAVNAKYIHSNPAVYSLRAYAGEELKEHIEIAEYTINNYMEDILADIYRRQPDVIGFSCYIWNWKMIEELLEEIPKILPGVPIWLGGPEVSYESMKTMEEHPGLTGIMVGEGEATFRELLEYYVEKEQSGSGMCGKHEEEAFALTGREDCFPEGERRTGLAQIPGLCLRSGYTAPRPLTCMDELPFLYENLDEFANKIIYYESGRGCPYRCSYCLSSIDRKVRLRDIEIVKKELQFFLDHRVAQVKFVDRTFNCNHDHAMAVWSYLLEHDNGVTNFHFEISADILREDEIALLHRMRPGLVQLEIGVQSTNPRTIAAINRVMNVERLERIVASIREGQNIHQHLDLIAGLPYEDYDSFGRSFNRVYGMKPQQLQLGFLKVLKGSEMYERAEEFGICYQNRPPYEVLYSRWLPYKDVLRLKKIEQMVELYYNSNQFVHTLSFLVKAFESPFAMFEKLAQFYEERGYLVNSPARAYRYHVLLMFTQELDPEKEAIYKELLVLDMYLRENLKTRPDFAAEPADYKEEIRAFYREEEQNRRYLPGYEGYDHRQMAKMTHLEPFRYPVWNEGALEAYPMKEADTRTADTNTADGAVTFLLFDYRSRNPLTYEAATQVIARTGAGK